jgi:hypothetical protein
MMGVMLVELAMASLGGALLADSAKKAREKRYVKAVLQGLPTVIAGSYDWNTMVDTIRVKPPFTVESAFRQFKAWLDSHSDVDSSDYKHRVYAMLLGSKQLTNDGDIQDDVPVHIVFQAEQDAAVITVRLDEGIYEVRKGGAREVFTGALEDDWRLQTAGAEEFAEWGDRIRHHLELTPSSDMEEIEPVVVAIGGTVLYVGTFGFHLPG